MTRSLLIDANVARSCADPARHETSEACLRVTQILAGRGCTVLVALTPKLEEEWRVHATRTFTSWWASMESRGRVKYEKDRRIADYRRAIAAIDDAGIRGLLEKDAHIVELAILQRHPVVSQDDKQVRHVTALAVSYPLLENVQWFNPVTSRDWEDWLDAGCEGFDLYRCVAA